MVTLSGYQLRAMGDLHVTGYRVKGNWSCIVTRIQIKVPKIRRGLGEQKKKFVLEKRKKHELGKRKMRLERNCGVVWARHFWSWMTESY